MTTATVGTVYSFTPTASDADGDALTFSASNVPNWATFNTATHVLSGTPTAAGTFSNVVISVSDGATTVSLPVFSIVVTAPVGGNRAPVISGSPLQSLAAGTAYSFTPTATDADGDTVAWSVSGLPSWLSFNASSHTISGTPAAANRGTTGAIVISVSDGKGGISSLAGFTITVVNRVPTLSGTPVTSVAAGSAYSFTPGGVDADGDTLTYSITSKPGWAAFNTSTGALTGSPASVDKGIFSDIVISASDGKGGSASLASFTITVMNTAPTITGTPVTTGKVGAAYSFIPTGSDANGDILAYSISNKPAWATFNTATGSLTGTPTATGTFSAITITVSDGAVGASLPAFAIAISAATTGTATVSWTAPTQNTDGSPLTDLAGYTIYYGTSSGNLNNSINVNSAATTSYTVSGLATGATYYFAVSAVNSSGVSSSLSDVGSKTI